MTNKTEMVSVPRALAQRFSDYAHLVGIPASSPQLAELREKLAAPADDVRAVGDEPVAWLASGLPFKDRARAREYADYKGCSELLPLYLAMCRQAVLPKPKRSPFSAADEGWNACLDELSRLNPQ